MEITSFKSWPLLFIELVRNYNDRAIPYVRYYIFDLSDVCIIQISQGLIQNKDRFLVQETAHECYALFLSTRQIAAIGLNRLIEP